MLLIIAVEIIPTHVYHVKYTICMNTQQILSSSFYTMSAIEHLVKDPATKSCFYRLQKAFIVII